MFFYLDDFNFNGLTDQNERHEYDKIIHASDAFAAERNVINCQSQPVADLKWHRSRLKGGGPMERFFAGGLTSL